MCSKEGPPIIDLYILNLYMLIGAENRTCVNPTQSCNCDISEGKWNSDEGYYISPTSLGITQMVFLQQKDLEEDALGRVTLGPLECVETSKTSQTFLFTQNH
jgi:hypothetical protein